MTASTTSQLFDQLWHGADYNYEQWLDYPHILDEDFRLMRLARCNMMSVGIFSWAMLEPEEGRYQFDWLDALMDRLAENGIAAALATPSAAPPPWLSREYPEIRRVDEHGLRQPHRRRQNFCYSSPVYREKVTTLNRMLAERYGTHPALKLWHVSNEYGATPCHCDLCYERFHTWLLARYSDLEALNHAWWTTFWSHRFTDWEQIEPVDDSLHGLMLDWQRFTSDQALDFFLAEAAPLREVTPEIPITTNFMQPDVGLDYWRFAPHMDIVSWDSYPRWHQGDDAETAMQTAFYHDLHRSYKGQPFLLIESSPSVTNWQGVSRLKRPGALLLTSLQALAHGSASVMYFQWRQSRGGEEKFHGAVVSHLGSEETRVFREVADVGKLLDGLQHMAGSRVRAKAAVVYDFENGWAINHAQLPRSIDKNYQETCIQHYGGLWKRGVPADIIPADADFGPYRLVIAPMLYMLRPGAAEKIEAFVQAGGVFVTTYLSGIVDVSDLCILGGYPAPLRRTLGIVSEEMDTLTDAQTGTLAGCRDNALGLDGCYRFRHYAELVRLETATALAAYDSEFYRGQPALTVNAHGAGRAYFIAARTDTRFLSDFYGGLLADLSLDAGLPGDLPGGVSVQIRENEAARYIFLMNFTDQPQRVAAGAGMTDAVTGDPVPQHIDLDAYEIRIVSQTRTGETS